VRYGEATNERFARFLREIDQLLVASGTLPAAEFFYVGHIN
jgi:hypothetical protein